MAKSAEEAVEDRAKKSLDDCDVGHFTEKNVAINSNNYWGILV